MSPRPIIRAAAAACLGVILGACSVSVNTPGVTFGVPTLPPSAALPTQVPTPPPTETPEPVATPTPIPSPTEAVTPTPAATETPEATESPSPTEGPTEPPPSEPPLETPGPTPEPGPSIATLGADSRRFHDDFTGTKNFVDQQYSDGSLAYANGGYEITNTVTNISRWAFAPALNKAYPVVKVVATLALTGDTTEGGVMCGNKTSDSQNLIYAIVTVSGEWDIGTASGPLQSATVTPLASGALSGDTLPDASGEVTLSIECAVTGGSNDRVLLMVNGIPVADFESAPRSQPFKTAALYGGTGDSTPSTVHFSELTVFGGNSYEDPLKALVKHVPSSFASQCNGAPITPDTGQTAGVSCVPAGTVEEADYYQYSSTSTMKDDFERIVSLEAAGADLSGSDCAVGPSETGYTIGGKHAGSLVCFDNQGPAGGIEFIWTDEQLNILTIGLGLTASYEAMNEWWTKDAGPNR